MTQQKRVIHVVGARPNYMKVAPLARAMGKRPDRWRQVLVHTGQHYDREMSEVFFRDLGLPQPDVYLGVGSGSHLEQYARVIEAFGPVLQEQHPDWVIVVGDVNSTLAAALAAAQSRIPVAHVEAGLRSFDRSMPEEINRVLTDHLSDLLFTTEASANRNLAAEGIPAEKIRFVGNTMIDTLAEMLPATDGREILTRLGVDEWAAGTREGAREPRRQYALVTLHRPSNVDDPFSLGEILAGLEEIAEETPVIFPLHPRTRKRIEENHLPVCSGRLRLLEPLGYLDFLALLRYASVVVTDSGGIQEETTFLGVPCLTIRPNTERPVTIEMGTNRLVGKERGAIVRATREVLAGRHEASEQPQRCVPPLWDGRTGERIVTELEAF